MDNQACEGSAFFSKDKVRLAVELTVYMLSLFPDRFMFPGWPGEGVVRWAVDMNWLSVKSSLIGFTAPRCNTPLSLVCGWLFSSSLSAAITMLFFQFQTDAVTSYFPQGTLGSLELTAPGNVQNLPLSMPHSLSTTSSTVEYSYLFMVHLAKLIQLLFYIFTISRLSRLRDLISHRVIWDSLYSVEDFFD